MDYDDYQDEEWVEDEDQSEDDLLVCPSCRREVHEDTQQCPYCGDWITAMYPRGAWRRFVWVVVVLLLVLALVLWIVR